METTFKIDNKNLAKKNGNTESVSMDDLVSTATHKATCEKEAASIMTVISGGEVLNRCRCFFCLIRFES